MHARGRGSDYEKNERMKMDPRDTVKLRASLVTQRDAEAYSGPRRQGKTGDWRKGRRGGSGAGVRGGGEATDEREAIEAKRELNVVE